MKRFILSLLLAFCFFYGLSQSENVALQDLLIQNTWTDGDGTGKMVVGKMVNARYRFTLDTLYVSLIELGAGGEVKKPYYLSETPDLSFNENRIGKCRNGDYLIINTRDTSPCVLKIKSYSDSLIEYEYYFKIKKQNIEYIRQGTFVPVE